MELVWTSLNLFKALALVDVVVIFLERICCVNILHTSTLHVSICLMSICFVSMCCVRICLASICLVSGPVDIYVAGVVVAIPIFCYLITYYAKICD